MSGTDPFAVGLGAAVDLFLAAKAHRYAQDRQQRHWHTRGRDLGQTITGRITINVGEGSFLIDKGTVYC